MSYSLFILELDRTVSIAEADGLVGRMTKSASRRDSVSPRVDGFLGDLDAASPISANKDSPWNEFSYCPDGVALDMVWSAVPELPTFVEDLAIDHGLTVYNPQGFGRVARPHLRQAPYLKLDVGIDEDIHNPDKYALHAAIDAVGEEMRQFAILGRKSADYIQTACNDGEWVIEWQEDGLHNHWQAETRDAEAIKRAFDAFAKGDDSYKSMFPFEKMEL